VSFHLTTEDCSRAGLLNAAPMHAVLVALLQHHNFCCSLPSWHLLTSKACVHSCMHCPRRSPVVPCRPSLHISVTLFKHVVSALLSGTKFICSATTTTPSFHETLAVGRLSNNTNWQRVHCAKAVNYGPTQYPGFHMRAQVIQEMAATRPLPTAALEVLATGLVLCHTARTTT